MENARRRSRKVELGRTEKRRLIQLGASVVLFLTVFIGKGILPQKMTDAVGYIRQALHANVDFSTAFSTAGDALSGGAPVLNTLGDFCVAVFGAESPAETTQLPDTSLQPSAEPSNNIPPVSTAQPTESTAPQESELPQATNQALTASEDVPATLSNAAANAPVRVRRLAYQLTNETQQPVGQEVLPVGAVVQDMPYTGEALPENVSMAWLSLGGLQTQDPIKGTLTSSFNYRTHPIDDVYRFHYGTDLAADIGTPIGAFSAGTVDFVGESEGYGLYVQLDHGNGVKSFYAHCSKILVHDGQQVSMGETIAEVGDTGKVTGPHLHFQIKVNNTWLNPIYYLTDQA